VTSVFSEWVARVHGDDISDPSGVGRVSGITLRDKDKVKLLIITAYRVCAGSIRTTPIGSSFAGEHASFKESGTLHPNPRKAYFDDISVTIKALQKADHKADHEIHLTFDANKHLIEGQQASIYLSKRLIFTTCRDAIQLHLRTLEQLTAIWIPCSAAQVF
jgi:hypothetical protein